MSLKYFTISSFDDQVAEVFSCETCMNILVQKQVDVLPSKNQVPHKLNNCKSTTFAMNILVS